MSGVTQTIDTYYAGMSNQPDLKKFPGQVKDIQNAIPDIVEGLYKRPGAKRIGTTPLTTNKYGTSSIPSGGSWFHYYRDETEGSYIGQVDENGFVRIWSCNDGTEKNVWYATDDATYSSGTAAHTAIASTTDLSPTTKYQLPAETHYAYLKTKGVGTSESIQALTINDTTYLVNRDRNILTTGTTTAREHTHYAFLDLLRTENGRQYSLNIYADETASTLKTATRIKIKSDDVPAGTVHGQGHCPAIGTDVFKVNHASNGSTNLIFRLDTRGASTVYIQGDGGTDDANDFSCVYSKGITLLHGGEGWSIGDEVDVTMEGYTYTIEITAAETLSVKGTIGGGANGTIRPEPTPFNSDTSVSPDSILGGITTAISGMSGSVSITTQVIGNSLYLHSTGDFNIEVVDKDLMRVMQSEVNDVSELPLQCKDGYIVKVSNASGSEQDDYYMKFIGEGGLDGPGAWKECAAPGIVKSLDATTMPHILERQEDGDFLVKKNTWADRETGDDDTNPMPSFVGKKINKVLFFRNRLAFLSGPNVTLSRPGELSVPAFFGKTALAVGAADPIDISCSSIFPSDLFDGIEVASGLAVFSTNQQFLLSSDAEIMNPDTAKLRSISTYNYNKDVPPISLGTTVGYIDNSGKYTRFNEMGNIQREQEPIVAEMSKLVFTLLPKNIDLLTNSRENSIVLFGKTDTDIVYAYKYLTYGEKREQQAWFKWKFNNPLKYHFIIDDEYYLLDTDNFLQKLNLMQQDTDPSINETVESDTSNYLIHLDNWTTVGSGTYSDTTKLTTFANQSDWIDQVTVRTDSDNNPINCDLVLVDIDAEATRVGRYAECTVTNTDDFTVPGNWDYSEEWEIAYTSVNLLNNFFHYGSIEHGLETGDPVRYVEGDTAAAGLTDGTTYYVIKVDANIIKLATNTTNANGGTAINITSQGTGVHKIQKLIPTLYIGYLYEYSVHFPTFYLTSAQGESAKSDVNSSLVIHRVKLNFGKSGLYTTTLQRAGKDDYSETYESSFADSYNVSDAPYVPENIQTVPVYEANNNVELLLKSSHPAPATLQALSWEGDYSPRNYKRV